MRLRTVLIVGALCAAGAAPVRAMPSANLAEVASRVSTNIENVGVVCGRYRCWSGPSVYYAPVVVAPPVVYGYGGCPPRWVGCGPHGYGGFYRPYGWYNGWGYRGLYPGAWY
jgi:hypothetical protein